MNAPTSWEQHVLEAEIGRENLIAWYRNPTGGDRAICVPYFIGETEKSQYPDFVFIHETADGVKASIVDPHNYAFANTIEKWQGLAVYAKKHETNFHRVDAVIEFEDELLSLDLLNAIVQQEIQKIGGADGILKLFKKHGGKYNG
jgi:type III restriction enzyme